jgi:hypothetical protein
MPLSLQHRHAVLLADRTRDVRTITTVITEVLAANPETTPLDIEIALRAATGQAYLVANSTTAGFGIVLGTPAWQAALADAGLTVEQNWAVLARRK